MKKKRLINSPILRIMSKTFTWILLAFLGIVATFFIYYIVSSKIYESKGINKQPAFSMYTIISPSMEPNINVYDVVFNKRVTDVNTIKEGDVITFISTSSLGEGLTITHRVKEIIKTEDGVKFRTKGDNNVSSDASLVSSENIIGKVLFKIPQLGRIQFLLQSKGGWLFVLLIPALAIVIYDVIKVIRLSSVKQKVNESLKEPEKDVNLENKQENLKKQLKKKFINISSIDPIVKSNIEDETKEDADKIVSVEEVDDYSNYKEEIEKIKEEEKEDNSILEENIKETEEPKKKKKKPKKVEKIEEIEEDSEILKNKEKIIKNSSKIKEEDFDIDKIIDNISDDTKEMDELPKIKKN